MREADGLDLSRREFMQVGTTSLLALQSGAIEQLDSDATVDEYQFQGVADLLGPDDALPAPNSAFFDNKVYYAYRYEATDTGNRYFITQDDSRWTQIMANPETQVEEVRVEDYKSFFNHTFARPESPDTKNWNFVDADVTKVNSEIELASTATLDTTQRGNYPPGTESIPGVAFRTTDVPTGGEALGGYFHANEGLAGGEDATDSFVLLRKGGTDLKIYRPNWNGYVPDGRVWANPNPVVTRFPHLFYGGGNLKVRALIHEKNATRLRTLHTFTPENVSETFPTGPPIQQPNLPVTFESASLTGANLRANACHYEFGESDVENRINGEHFTGKSAGTSGWTALLAWRKRAGWDMVNVKPFKIAAQASTNDAKLGLQLDPTLDGTETWGLPTNTSSSETAVEVSTDAVLSSNGERRWVGYATAGQANKGGSVSQADVNFNLPADQVIVLAAQGVGGTSDLAGVVGWEEFF